jgi:hypothetical protein
MARRFDRRDETRSRVTLTALVRSGRRKNPVILRVANLGHGGARCRTRVPFRLGAAFHAEFVLEGKCVQAEPRVLELYCRVVWTSSVDGPSCQMQELGLEFPEMDPAQRRHLDSFLQAAEAA